MKNTQRQIFTSLSLESVRSYYNLIIKKAGQFLTDLQVNLLKLSLSLRAYSPAVHAFQQVSPFLFINDFIQNQMIDTSGLVKYTINSICI